MFLPTEYQTTILFVDVFQRPDRKVYDRPLSITVEIYSNITYDTETISP